MATPISAMAFMGVSETTSGLSSSGVSSAAAGSAVADGGVGVVGVSTAVVLGAAAIGGAAVAAGGGGGDDSGGGSSNNNGSTDVSDAAENDFIGTYQATDPNRSYDDYHGEFIFNSGGTGSAVETVYGEILQGPISWSFDESTDTFSIWVLGGGSFSGLVTGTTDNFTLTGVWNTGEPGTLNLDR